MCVSVNEVQDVLTLILTLIGILTAAGLIIWQAILYKQLSINEVTIRKKQDEIDAVETSVNGRTAGAVVESQRQKLIENERKPLLRDLERLQEERQFIRDKLLFTKK